MTDFGSNSYAYLDHQQAFAATFGRNDHEVADHYRGVLAGMMGLPSVPGASEAFAAGYTLGAAGKAKSEELRIAKAARDEAFQERQREKGRRSAEARRARSGSAQPARTGSENVEDLPNRGSANPRTVVRGTSNRGSNRGSEFLEPLRKEGSKEGVEQEADASCFSLDPTLTGKPARERSGSAQGSGSANAKIPLPCPRDRRPSRDAFLAYAAARWPEWHRQAVAGIWDRWSRNGRGWCTPDNEPIRDWLALLEKFRSMADPAHLGERLPLGQFAAHHAADAADRMRFRP